MTTLVARCIDSNMKSIDPARSIESVYGLVDKVSTIVERLSFLLVELTADSNAGWTKDDVDLWEVNEAFAVVPMAFMHEMGLDHDIVNVNGGACALGHPIGASGARIMVTLLNALEKRNLKRGVAAICIGGGEGTAIAIERV